MKEERMQVYSVFDEERNECLIIIQFGESRYALSIEQGILIGSSILQAAGLSASKSLVCRFAREAGLETGDVLQRYNEHLAELLEDGAHSRLTS